MKKIKPFRLASNPGRSYPLPRGSVFCTTLSDGTESVMMSDHFQTESKTRSQALKDLANDMRDIASALDELSLDKKVINHE